MAFRLPGIRAKNAPSQRPAGGSAPSNQGPATPAAPPTRPFASNPDEFSVTFNAHTPGQQGVQGAGPGSVRLTKQGSGTYRMTRSFERPASTPEERLTHGMNGMVPHEEDWGEYDERDISHNPETGEFQAFNRNRGMMKLSTHAAQVTMDNRPRLGDQPTTEFPSWMQHASGPSGWSRNPDKINRLR